MKTHYIGTNISSKRKNAKGFTLIEILTVLAVIGILVGLSTLAYNKVTSLTRVNGTVKLVSDLKTAVSDAAQKLGGTLPVTEGAAAVPTFTGTAPASAATFNAAARLEQVLISIPDALLTNFFTPPAGSQVFTATPAAANDPRYVNGTWVGGAAAPVHSWAAVSRLEAAATTATVPDGTVANTNGTNFLLDGSTSLPLGGVVAYAVVKNVAGSEAYKIALLLDKSSLMVAASNDNAAVGQTKGGAIYAAANASGLTDVYIYLGNF